MRHYVLIATYSMDELECESATLIVVPPSWSSAEDYLGSGEIMYDGSTLNPVVRTWSSETPRCDGFRINPDWMTEYEAELEAAGEVFAERAAAVQAYYEGLENMQNLQSAEAVQAYYENLENMQSLQRLVGAVKKPVEDVQLPEKP